mmetsp:Transcript_4464/g.13361  ORF Transcript_4464/g.13361 Transcript_4464/m.13361 type:complete len:213 (-) Transcript_4464:469-1107(-)
MVAPRDGHGNVDPEGRPRSGEHGTAAPGLLEGGPRRCSVPLKRRVEPGVADAEPKDHTEEEFELVGHGDEHDDVSKRSLDGVHGDEGGDFEWRRRGEGAEAPADLGAEFRQDGHGKSQHAEKDHFGVGVHGPAGHEEVQAGSAAPLKKRRETVHVHAGGGKDAELGHGWGEEARRGLGTGRWWWGRKKRPDKRVLHRGAVSSPGRDHERGLL